LARPGTLAGHQQHDRLAGLARLACQRQEQRRPPHLFDVHRDHARLRIADVVGEDVLDADRGLVARRRHRGEHEPAAEEGVAQVGRHRAALSDHADARPSLRRRGRQRLEGDRDTGLVVGEAHAVRPHDQQAGLACGRRHLVLLAPALIAGLRIAGGEQHRRPDAPSSERSHGVEHAGLRDREYGQVDAFRQFVDHLDAGTAVDLGAAAADQVNGAGIAEALQVAEHETAERTRVGRGADDDDRAGSKDPGDRMGG
jgi:hypothetical protein